MAQPPPDLLGRLAVHYGMISMPQLSAATREQDRAPHRKLGEILVELGFIGQPQLGQLLEAQRQYLAQQAGSAGQALADAQHARGQAPTPAAMPRRPPRARPHSAATSVPVGTRRQPGPPRPRPPTGPLAPPPPPPGPAQAQTPAAPAAAPEAPAQAAPKPRIKAPPSRNVATSPQRVQWLHRVLDHACSIDASDVHLHAGATVKVRVYHKLRDLMPDPLGEQEVESVLMSVMTPGQRDVYQLHGEVDFTYAVPNIGRFRTNIYYQHGGPAACFHYIPAQPPNLEDLGLPSAMSRLIAHQNGIVLITGPAGSGKTSTMAALINLLNDERSDHVLSIEDPIEYIHRSKRAIINQREVNRHTHSFSNALHSALREDPDVICIGELRDLETISLALSAAETGHLVLGTLHTQGAIRTINRIVGAYPPTQQPQIRTMLSESLRAIISQKLIPRADGHGMALAYELLMANVAASNLIRENRTFQLGQVLQMGRGRGMRSMDESLMELVKAGVISKRAAAHEAEDPRAFAE